MKTDGSGERILPSGYHNEGPTFAPNGRVVMFFREPGGNSGPSLFTVDISGRNELRVPTPGFASDPAWSPLLSYRNTTARVIVVNRQTLPSLMIFRANFSRPHQKQRPGNDVPSERLHLGRVELRTLTGTRAPQCSSPIRAE